MGWGSTEDLFAGGKNGGWQATVTTTRKMEVVFVSSGDFARTFFHAISEKSLTFKDVAIVHGSDEVLIEEAELARKIDGAKVVVIGTCKRRSIVKDSRAQQTESFAAAEARRTGARIVLFSELVHEVAQPHLEAARDAKPIVMVQENFSGPCGFLDLFPIGSEFVRVEHTDEALVRMGTAILRQLHRAERSAPGWNWD